DDLLPVHNWEVLLGGGEQEVCCFLECCAHWQRSEVGDHRRASFEAFDQRFAAVHGSFLSRSHEDEESNHKQQRVLGGQTKETQDHCQELADRGGDLGRS